MGLQLQVIAALTPFLMSDLGFSYSRIGILVGLFVAPGVLLALPSSLFCARFGFRNVGLCGLILMAAGSLVLIVVDNFWWAAGARLLGGTGGILLNVAFLRLTAELFEGKAYNLAIGVVMGSWAVGLGVTATSVPLLATAGDWRLPFWLISGLTLLAALAIYLFAPAAPRGASAQGALWPHRLDSRSRVLSLLLGSSFACFTAGGIVFLSFGTTFLMDAGIGLTKASAVVGLFTWASLFGTPLGGWLADRRTGAGLSIYLGAVGAAVMMTFMVVGTTPVIAALMLGLCWGLPAAPFTGLLQRLLPANALGAGYGLYFMLFYCGFFAFPALGGWLVDVTEATSTALWLGVLLLAVAALLYRLARWRAERADLLVETKI